MPLLNIGLDSSQGPIGLPLVFQVLNAYRVVTHDFAVHQSDTEKTLVLLIDEALPADDAYMIAFELYQDCIAQVSNGIGTLHGPRAEQWAPFNAKFFLLLDGSRLA